ncbi:Lrp/AsnC family transcriptional regulator [Roseovarius nanhaiticus]|uniref:Transcriptional regulator, AsnC family n=1 Tax=Roseovarius nanhaiticus TaxID=573024 RepID=A0A1N7HBM9_9RHOB|nr:Lrp/AsnC family transcriptional regulator [Roseovarius nanhaiticus]SEL04009.1 transcriptional regulator, AsnC family [Roseovarius nanhaiticus]SIS22276.1 transcriptional regulator, AsnC family [Roseovarius nanhaiticus]
MKKLGLDAADIRILSAVQQHGQLSKVRLAELVNLSPTPCWARLDRLKAAGYIRSYHAELALDRIMDFTQVVVTVSLGSHRKAEFVRFEDYVQKQDEIIECIATGGGMDYVMKVVTPSLAAFQEAMDHMLSAELAIDRYMTYIATRQIKTSRPNLAKLIGKGDN